MAAPAFGDTLTIAAAGDGIWRGDADPAFANGIEDKLLGQFGGWVAAVLVRAILGEAQSPGMRALTVHFLSAVRPGALSVRVRPMRKGRNVAFWQADLVQGDDVRAHAVATLGEARSDPHAHTFLVKPAAPAPDANALPSGGPPGKLGETISALWVAGPPFAGHVGGESLFWAFSRPETMIDAAKLVLLADNMPPRVFYVANTFVPSTTLSLTIYFRASPEELASAGAGYVLTHVVGRRVGAGFWDHTASFWSESGALLATSEQLAMHRG